MLTEPFIFAEYKFTFFRIVEHVKYVEHIFELFNIINELEIFIKTFTFQKYFLNMDFSVQFE